MGATGPDTKKRASADGSCAPAALSNDVNTGPTVKFDDSAHYTMVTKALRFRSAVSQASGSPLRFQSQKPSSS